MGEWLSHLIASSLWSLKKWGTMDSVPRQDPLGPRPSCASCQVSGLGWDSPSAANLPRGSHFGPSCRECPMNDTSPVPTTVL